MDFSEHHLPRAGAGGEAGWGHQSSHYLILSTYKLISFFLPFHHRARLLCALVIVFSSHFEPSAKASNGIAVLSSEGSGQVRRDSSGRAPRALTRISHYLNLPAGQMEPAVVRTQVF